MPGILNQPAQGILSRAMRPGGILGAALDPQFYRDMGANVPDAMRGLLAQTAGAPVDIMTMLMRPFGYQTPDRGVVGSTEWIGQKLGADVDRLPFKITSMLPTDAGDLMKYGPALAAIGATKKLPPSLEYRISHRPMNDEGGAARLHDLGRSFGEDVYGPNALQYFGSGDIREKNTIKLMQKIRGQPEAEITIYRGVPAGSGHKINPGDWVTLDRQVAQDYGEQVLEMKVKAKDITSWPDSLLEFGYHPHTQK